MKATLSKLMKETVVNEIGDKSTLSLMIAVLLKYGIAPIACIYLGYVLLMKDQTIDNLNERYNTKLTTIIESQTTATVKNTEIQGQLIKVIEANTRKLEDIEKKK